MEKKKTWKRKGKGEEKKRIRKKTEEKEREMSRERKMNRRKKKEKTKNWKKFTSILTTYLNMCRILHYSHRTDFSCTVSYPRGIHLYLGSHVLCPLSNPLYRLHRTSDQASKVTNMKIRNVTLHHQIKYNFFSGMTFQLKI